VLLNIGDNFGDFVDEYRGTEAERLQVMEQHRDRWGRGWIMIANPSYGSFESAPFGRDFKLSGRREAEGQAQRPRCLARAVSRAPSRLGHPTA
jgi:predicted secreted acid phosphatase